jgi:putative peptidoglycan lipid II flippase
MSERLGRSAGMIGLATFTSRLLGLVRDQATAYYFGTTWRADAFVVATRIPTLLRDLFAEGAMSAAFVPTLTRTLAKDGKEAAWRLGSQVINGLLIVTGILVVLGIVFADPLTSSYAAKFAKFPGKLELTIALTRINMPFLMLIALAAACMGMLNALRRFLVPAAAPATYNVVFIGMLGGGLAQFLIQLPALRREGYRHQWILDLKDPVLHEVLVLMGPGTLGVAAAQINLFVNTWLATDVDGAATALRYAFQLIYLPIGIFGVSVATAAIPELARQAADGAHADMTKTVSWGIRLMLVLSIPAIVGLMVLASPIVELIFQHGAFNSTSTFMTAGALALYAPGILGYSLVKIVSPSFYSLREARTPVVVSVVTIILNLGLNLWLNSIYGFKGLALGTAIAANANAGLLMYLLSKRLGGIDFPRIAVTFAKTCVAAALMGVAAYYAEAWLHGIFSQPAFLYRLIRVGGAIGIALAVLAASAHLLRLEEFSTAMARVMRRKT